MCNKHSYLDFKIGFHIKCILISLYKFYLEYIQKLYNELNLSYTL